MKSYLICIINSCFMIAASWLDEPRFSFKLFRIATAPSYPSFSSLLPGIPFPSSSPRLSPFRFLKCRQISSSMWLHPLPTMHRVPTLALDVAGSCLYRGLICSPLSYRLTCSSRWLPLLRQHLDVDVVAMATAAGLTPPPLPFLFSPHTLCLSYRHNASTPPAPPLLL